MIRGLHNIRPAYQQDRAGLLWDVSSLTTVLTKGAVARLDRAPYVSRATVDGVWAEAAAHFRAWRAGEADGLDSLVRALTPVLWQVVRAYGLDRDRAEDVVQSTWLSLVHRHQTIADPQAVGSWLTTTARREAWRARQRDTRLMPAQADVVEHYTSQQPSAEASAVSAIEEDRLWRSVSSLSSRCQRLLRVIAFQPRPDYRSLSQDLGMPIGSIGPTRRRCLDKLRSLWQEEGVHHA